MNNKKIRANRLPREPKSAARHTKYALMLPPAMAFGRQGAGRLCACGYAAA